MKMKRLGVAAQPIAAALAVGGLMTGGCGGGGSDSDPDAGDVTPEPDACVPGHGQACEGNTDNVLSFPEGGEVRIEFFELEYEQAYLLNAAEAHFYKDQTPASRQIFGDVIPLDEGRELADSSFCLDGTPGTHYNLVEYEENQAIYDTRDYIDAGEWVRLIERDGDTMIQMDRTIEGISNAQGLNHEIIYLPEEPFLEGPENYVPPQNSWLDIEIAGSAELPQLTPANGFNFVSETPLDDFAMYFPSRYDMLGPDPENEELSAIFEERYFNGEGVDAGGIAYIEGQDRTFYVPVTNEPPEDAPATVYIVALFNQNNGVHTYCLNGNFEEERTVTVPYEAIARLPQELDEDGEPTGYRRGRHSLLHITHFGYVYEGRQLHVMGMACKTSYQGWCAFESADDADAEFQQFCPEGYWDDAAPVPFEARRALQREVGELASAAMRRQLP